MKECTRAQVSPDVCASRMRKQSHVFFSEKLDPALGVRRRRAPKSFQKYIGGAGCVRLQTHASAHVHAPECTRVQDNGVRRGGVGGALLGHNYIGHDYMSHNYIGHDYVGHFLIGHHYVEADGAPLGPPSGIETSSNLRPK